MLAQGIDIDTAVKRDRPSTLGRGPTFVGISAGDRSTGRNGTAYHSYHTWRWSVRYHMEAKLLTGTTVLCGEHTFIRCGEEGTVVAHVFYL
jgi:hypothetical protein